MLSIGLADKYKFLDYKHLSFGINYTSYRNSIKPDAFEEKKLFDSFRNFLIIACGQIRQRFLLNSDDLLLLSYLDPNVFLNDPSAIVNFTKLFIRFGKIIQNKIDIVEAQLRELFIDKARIIKVVKMLEDDHKLEYEDSVKKNVN